MKVQITDKIDKIEPASFQYRDGTQFNGYKYITEKGYDFYSQKTFNLGDYVVLDQKTTFVAKIDL